MKTLDILSITKGKTTFQREKISSSNNAAAFIKKFYCDDIDIYESIFILLLNRNNFTIGYAKISQGGVSGTVCDPKIIAKYIADTLASSIILAHNHPSGSLIPSGADKDLTAKIKEVCKILDSQLIDHLILTSENYFSFADEGLL